MEIKLGYFTNDLILCRGENSKSTVELAGINPDEIIKEELLQKIIVCGARTEEMETAKNKIMYGLVRYMPAESGETVCTEEQIYKDWEKYLSEQKHYFAAE